MTINFVLIPNIVIQAPYPQEVPLVEVCICLADIDPASVVAYSLRTPDALYDSDRGRLLS